MLPDALVTSTLPCTACGYNLRMQPQNSRCPECAQEISVSLEFSLATRGPAYLRTLAAAARFSAVLNITAVAVTGLFILTQFLLFLSGFNGDRTIFLIFLFISYTLIALLHLVGASAAMTPMPKESHRLLRPLLLGAASTFVAATVAPLLMSLSLTSRHGPPESFVKTIVTGWTLLFPALPIFILTLGFRYATLCKNAGIHSLVGWHRWTSRLLASALVSLSGAFWIITCIILVEPRGFPPRWSIIIAGALLYGGLFIAGIAYITATLLLLRTATRFRRLAHDLTQDDPNDLPPTVSILDHSSSPPPSAHD